MIQKRLFLLFLLSISSAVTFSGDNYTSHHFFWKKLQDSIGVIQKNVEKKYKVSLFSNVSLRLTNPELIIDFYKDAVREMIKAEDVLFVDIQNDIKHNRYTLQNFLADTALFMEKNSYKMFTAAYVVQYLYRMAYRIITNEVVPDLPKQSLDELICAVQAVLHESVTVEGEVVDRMKLQNVLNETLDPAMQSFYTNLQAPFGLYCGDLLTVLAFCFVEKIHQLHSNKKVQNKKRASWNDMWNNLFNRVRRSGSAWVNTLSSGRNLTYDEVKDCRAIKDLPDSIFPLFLQWCFVDGTLHYFEITVHNISNDALGGAAVQAFAQTLFNTKVQKEKHEGALDLLNSVQSVFQNLAYEGGKSIGGSGKQGLSDVGVSSSNISDYVAEVLRKKVGSCEPTTVKLDKALKQAVSVSEQLRNSI